MGVWVMRELLLDEPLGKKGKEDEKGLDDESWIDEKLMFSVSVLREQWWWIKVLARKMMVTAQVS